MVKNPATPSGVHTPCKEGGKDEWWVTNCDTHNDPFYLCSEKHALLARVGELTEALKGLLASSRFTPAQGNDNECWTVDQNALKQARLALSKQVKHE